ncbi:MAG: hypothetical protein ACRD96_11565 [Bryobacteraceae bacterium]
MAHRRAHVLLPEDLVAQIDTLVGSRRRSAFLAEIARREVKRLHLIQLLESGKRGWKEKDHPELAKGAAAWVSRMRREDSQRDAKRIRGG